MSLFHRWKNGNIFKKRLRKEIIARLAEYDWLLSCSHVFLFLLTCFLDFAHVLSWFCSRASQVFCSIACLLTPIWPSTIYSPREKGSVLLPRLFARAPLLSCPWCGQVSIQPYLIHSLVHSNIGDTPSPPPICHLGALPAANPLQLSGRVNDPRAELDAHPGDLARKG